MQDIHDNSSLNDLSNTICFLSEPWSPQSAKMFMGFLCFFIITILLLMVQNQPQRNKKMPLQPCSTDILFRPLEENLSAILNKSLCFRGCMEESLNRHNCCKRPSPASSAPQSVPFLQIIGLQKHQARMFFSCAVGFTFLIPEFSN